MTTHRSVRCPTCGREHRWTQDNRSRPFCSERCRLIDLGAWLEERHAIPGEPAIADPGADAATNDGSPRH